MKCHYCYRKAEYDQPEKTSGEIVSVCRKHFIYIQAS